ncbi:iron-containing redox enzyme family protein, partial [Burkholderia gladioli]
MRHEMAATAQDLPFRAFERETADSTRIDAVLAEASMLSLPAAVALLCDSDAFDEWPDATPESGERFLAAVRATLSRAPRAPRPPTPPHA